MYIPGGTNQNGGSPFYGCRAYEGEYLVQKDINGPDIQKLQSDIRGYRRGGTDARPVACGPDRLE